MSLLTAGATCDKRVIEKIDLVTTFSSMLDMEKWPLICGYRPYLMELGLLSMKKEEEFVIINVILIPSVFIYPRDQYLNRRTPFNQKYCEETLFIILTTSISQHQ